MLVGLMLSDPISVNCSTPPFAVLDALIVSVPVVHGPPQLVAMFVKPGSGFMAVPIVVTKGPTFAIVPPSAPGNATLGPSALTRKMPGTTLGVPGVVFLK